MQNDQYSAKFKNNAQVRKYLLDNQDEVYRYLSNLSLIEQQLENTDINAQKHKSLRRDRDTLLLKNEETYNTFEYCIKYLLDNEIQLPQTSAVQLVFSLMKDQKYQTLFSDMEKEHSSSQQATKNNIMEISLTLKNDIPLYRKIAVQPKSTGIHKSVFNSITEIQQTYGAQFGFNNQVTDLSDRQSDEQQQEEFLEEEELKQYIQQQILQNRSVQQVNDYMQCQDTSNQNQELIQQVDIQENNQDRQLQEQINHSISVTNSISFQQNVLTQNNVESKQKLLNLANDFQKNPNDRQLYLMKDQDYQSNNSSFGMTSKHDVVLSSSQFALYESNERRLKQKIEQMEEQFMKKQKEYISDVENLSKELISAQSQLGESQLREEQVSRQLQILQGKARLEEQFANQQTFRAINKLISDCNYQLNSKFQNANRKLMEVETSLEDSLDKISLRFRQLKLQRQPQQNETEELQQLRAALIKMDEELCEERSKMQKREAQEPLMVQIGQLSAANDELLSQVLQFTNEQRASKDLVNLQKTQIVQLEQQLEQNDREASLLKSALEQSYIVKLQEKEQILISQSQAEQKLQPQLEQQKLQIEALTKQNTSLQLELQQMHIVKQQCTSLEQSCVSLISDNEQLKQMSSTLLLQIQNLEQQCQNYQHDVESLQQELCDCKININQLEQTIQENSISLHQKEAATDALQNECLLLKQSNFQQEQTIHISNEQILSSKIDLQNLQDEFLQCKQKFNALESDVSGKDEFILQLKNQLCENDQQIRASVNDIKVSTKEQIDRLTSILRSINITSNLEVVKQLVTRMVDIHQNRINQQLMSQQSKEAEHFNQQQSFEFEREKLLKKQLLLGQKVDYLNDRLLQINQNIILFEHGYQQNYQIATDFSKKYNVLTSEVQEVNQRFQQNQNYLSTFVSQCNTQLLELRKVILKTKESFSQSHQFGGVASLITNFGKACSQLNSNNQLVTQQNISLRQTVTQLSQKCDQFQEINKITNNELSESKTLANQQKQIISFQAAQMHQLTSEISELQKTQKQIVIQSTEMQRANDSKQLVCDSLKQELGRQSQYCQQAIRNQQKQTLQVVNQTKRFAHQIKAMNYSYSKVTQLAGKIRLLNQQTQKVLAFKHSLDEKEQALKQCFLFIRQIQEFSAIFIQPSQSHELDIQQRLCAADEMITAYRTCIEQTKDELNHPISFLSTRKSFAKQTNQSSISNVRSFMLSPPFLNKQPQVPASLELIFPNLELCKHQFLAFNRAFKKQSYQIFTATGRVQLFVKVLIDNHLDQICGALKFQNSGVQKLLQQFTEAFSGALMQKLSLLIQFYCGKEQIRDAIVSINEYSVKVLVPFDLGLKPGESFFLLHFVLTLHGYTATNEIVDICQKQPIQFDQQKLKYCNGLVLDKSCYLSMFPLASCEEDIIKVAALVK